MNWNIHMENKTQKHSIKLYFLFILLSILIFLFYLFVIFKQNTYQSIWSEQTKTVSSLSTFSARLSQTQTSIVQSKYTATPLSHDFLKATAMAKLPDRLKNGLPPQEDIFDNKDGLKSFYLIQDKDNYLEDLPLGVKASDFIIELTYINPTEISIPFDYGLIFRNKGFNNQYRLMIVPKSRDWEITYWNAEKNATSENIDSGNFGGISPFSDSKNKIRLVVYQNTGWLYINDGFVTKFSLFDNNKGGISIVTDMEKNHILAGRKIEFKDVNFWWNK